MFKAMYNGPSGQNILIKNRGNNAKLTGIRPMPQKFYPSANDSMFSNARVSYVNECGNNPTAKQQTFDACNNDQSGYIQRRKMNAVGKSSVPRTTETISFRSQNPNDVRSSLRKCRSGGCVAPAKKGANISYKSGGSSNITGTGGNRTISY